MLQLKLRHWLRRKDLRPKKQLVRLLKPLLSPRRKDSRQKRPSVNCAKLKQLLRKRDARPMRLRQHVLKPKLMLKRRDLKLRRPRESSSKLKKKQLEMHLLKPLSNSESPKKTLHVNKLKLMKLPELNVRLKKKLKRSDWKPRLPNVLSRKLRKTLAANAKRLRPPSKLLRMPLSWPRRNVSKPKKLKEQE